MNEVLDSLKDLFLVRLPGGSQSEGPPHPWRQSDYVSDRLWSTSDSARAVSEHCLESLHRVLHHSCIGQGFEAPERSEIVILVVLVPFGAFWRSEAQNLGER